LFSIVYSGESKTTFVILTYKYILYIFEKLRSSSFQPDTELFNYSGSFLVIIGQRLTCSARVSSRGLGIEAIQMVVGTGPLPTQEAAKSGSTSSH
jgi:hypothetical protein